MKENKLIAEFMGVKPIVLGGSTEYEMYGVLDCIEDGVDEKHFFIDDEMRFQESWDWLMAVVDKIEGLGYWVNRNDGDVTISNKSDIVVITPMSSGGIDMMYKAVVEFIKQYNDGEQ